ncbi:MAG TPA: thioredoxin [Acidimicrobiales bacterium]|nr:thioredoxin [Acidimicrobiales bacterium]
MTHPEITCHRCNARNRVPANTSGRPTCGKCHEDLAWLSDLGGADFASVIESSSVPVLVDLWARWCGPCRVVAPALEDLAKARAGKLRILKVDVDEAPSVSERLGVRGIPTLVLFNHGAEVARTVGAMPGERIRQWVDTSLAWSPAS